MTLDPRTPVLVGAAVLTQRVDDPAAGEEAVDLMVRVAHLAAGDAGAPGLLARVGQVTVPQGTWAYPDPGRLVAEGVGAHRARTVLSEIGVLQQDALTEACTGIAEGRLDVALVVGGEAKHRAVRAAVAGIVLPDATQPDGTGPDEVLTAATLGVHDIEILRHAVDPPTAYALIEHALAHHDPTGFAAHRAGVGELWAGFAAVAAADPHAWDRSAPDAATILDPAAAGNRMIATPYTKRCCSQWNVDMAAALVLCSTGAAEAAGVPRDRWVFPHAAAVANHSVPVVARPELHRCPGAAMAGRRVLSLAGVRPDELAVVDLYSCFPSAVQVYAAEVGLGLDPVPTVTGGMTFGGGPLNSYVLHALATMVPTLRADPEARALSSSVSGFLTKQGFGVWSATPPAGGFRADDLTRAVAAVDDPLPVDPEHTGPATVAGWTVVHDRSGPVRVVAICDTSAAARTIATTDAADVVETFLAGDWTGRSVAVPTPGSLALP